MEMLPFQIGEARETIELLVNRCERKPGEGDFVLLIRTTSGEERSGYIVERDGERSREGVLLNDGGDAIRYEEMVVIGGGFGV